MTEEDLRAVLAKYQQKAFELYNTNIVLETQVEQLTNTVSILKAEILKLSSKPKRALKQEEDFS
jgi:hypothetical protein